VCGVCGRARYGTDWRRTICARASLAAESSTRCRVTVMLFGGLGADSTRLALPVTFTSNSGTRRRGW